MTFEKKTGRNGRFDERSSSLTVKADTTESVISTTSSSGDAPVCSTSILFISLNKMRSCR